MHIGFYLDEWRSGGIAILVTRICGELNRLGHRTTLFLARPVPKRSESDRRCYQRYRKVSGQSCVSLDLAAYPNCWRESHFVETVLKHDVECIFPSLYRLQLGGFEKLAPYIPVIGIAHNDHSYFYDEYFMAQAFLAAQIAPSHQIYERCRRLAAPELKEKVRHIVSGVHIPTQADATPIGPLKVVYCSRLEWPQKRSLDLAGIWKLFLAEGGLGVLSIIGRGEQEQALRSALSREQAEGNVRFLGHLEEEAVGAEVATGDVIINLSNFEAFPQSVTEGAARGLWPLLSDTESGHREIVELLGHGTLCPIGDNRAFARALLELGSKTAELRQKRPFIRANAGKCFNLETCAKAYLDLAQEMAADYRRRPPPPPFVAEPRDLKDRLHHLLLAARYRRHQPHA
jgi:glycosyltransferase involved in cell wall biosynthesis